MNFQFFESLSVAEAEEFLRRFLEVESGKVEELLRAVRAEGLLADFSLASIYSLFEWVLRRASSVPKEPDLSLPDWIRNTSSYSQGLFEFDDFTKEAILQCAYYMGESFARASPILKWGIGNRDFAEQNQPVITGFRQDIEMPPILVTENIFQRVSLRGASPTVVQSIVDYWSERIGPS